MRNFTIHAQVGKLGDHGVICCSDTFQYQQTQTATGVYYTLTVDKDIPNYDDGSSDEDLEPGLISDVRSFTVFVSSTGQLVYSGQGL